MNATPININPANAGQPQPAAGRQQDSATEDVPFSQVLSSEMAQSRRHSSEVKQGADIDANQDKASQAGKPTELGASTVVITTEILEAASDPLALPLAGDTTIDPATLHGLISPDQIKPAPAKTGSVDADQSSDKATNTLLFQNSRNGRTTQVGQLAENARDMQKIDPAVSGKVSPQATTTATLATAFSGQLAAARQPDAMKGEFQSDPVSNPAMRPPSQAAFETVHASNEVASPKLAPTVGTAAWNQALGDKVVWMAAGAQQSATLTLNPPNMGPLQIVLNLTNDQATASFFSAQPEVRQALEAAFPRLKEMMNEAGIQLEQATVSADTPRQDAPSDHPGQRISQPFGGDEAVTTGVQAIPVPIQQHGRGLIDTFA